MRDDAEDEREFQRCQRAVSSTVLTTKSGTVKTKIPKVKRKRKPFQVKWVKLPGRWIDVLGQSKSASTHHLGHIILREAFKRRLVGREVVLSEEVTGMTRSTKVRAARELVELGLIEIGRVGGQALRVTHIYY